MTWGMIGGAAIGVVGGVLSSKSQSKAAAEANQASIDAAKLDPRQEAIIYGEEGGTGGLLGEYQRLGQTPQDPRLTAYGNENLDYLGNTRTDQDAIRLASSKLMGGMSATGQGPLAYMTGTQVQAPSQNNIDLTDSYNKFISGDSSKNPLLTGAIQGAIGQSQQAFDRMKDDTTRNLTENILPSIRSNAVLAGGLGGSRQGVAEGRAIGDSQRELARATENFGNNNTTAGVTAQAAEFSRGQDRALSATQGLGAQQYGVAQQNAQTANSAEAMNVANTNNVNADWARRNDAAQVTGQSGLLAGAGLLSGQLAGAYGAGQDRDNADINRATQVNGLLQPYLTRNNNVPAMQPVYSNTAGSALGGAMAGMSLYNQFKQGKTAPPATGGNQDYINMWMNGGSAAH